MGKKAVIKRSNNGLAIVLLMIVLIVATAIGIWGLTSSRSSLLKAGSRKFSTELSYQAEQGLQKAVRRLQAIGSASSSDPVSTTNNADNSPGKSGGDYSQKTITYFLGTGASHTGGLCAEATCSGSPNPTCPTFDAVKNYDVKDVNVICNFLGVVDKNTQVVVVRKNDLVANGQTFAILLVNSVAMDSGGRKQAIQGVVVIPYDVATGLSTDSIYMANSKAVTD